MSDLYLDLLAATIMLGCAAAVVVMVIWMIPDSWRSWRESTGADKTYSWWVLARTIVLCVSLSLFAFVGLAVATLEDDSALRQQFTRHALFFAIIGVAAVGLWGPVERRSIQRAVREDDDERGRDGASD